jgi:hypothetical protein
MNAKLEAMQEAMNDELFLADLREVMQDFRYVDSEEPCSLAPSSAHLRLTSQKG